MQHSTSSEACGSSQADSTSSTHLFHPEFPLHGPSTSTSHTVPSVRSFTVSLLGPGFVPKVLGGRRWTQNSPPSGFNWLSNRQTINLSASEGASKSKHHWRTGNLLWSLGPLKCSSKRGKGSVSTSARLRLPRVSRKASGHQSGGGQRWIWSKENLSTLQLWR